MMVTHAGMGALERTELEMGLQLFLYILKILNPKA